VIDNISFISRLLILSFIPMIPSQYFQFANDILACVNMITVSFQVEEYLNMFQHVAKSYIKIMICFLPYLMGFAGAFQGDYVRLNVFNFILNEIV